MPKKLPKKEIKKTMAIRIHPALEKRLEKATYNKSRFVCEAITEKLERDGK